MCVRVWVRINLPVCVKYAFRFFSSVRNESAHVLADSGAGTKKYDHDRDFLTRICSVRPKNGYRARGKKTSSKYSI